MQTIKDGNIFNKLIRITAMLSILILTLSFCLHIQSVELKAFGVTNGINNGVSNFWETRPQADDTIVKSAPDDNNYWDDSQIFSTEFLPNQADDLRYSSSAYSGTNGETCAINSAKTGTDKSCPIIIKSPAEFVGAFNDDTFYGIKDIAPHTISIWNQYFNNNNMTAQTVAQKLYFSLEIGGANTGTDANGLKYYDFGAHILIPLYAYNSEIDANGISFYNAFVTNKRNYVNNNIDETQDSMCYYLDYLISQGISQAVWESDFHETSCDEHPGEFFFAFSLTTRGIFGIIDLTLIENLNIFEIKHPSFDPNDIGSARTPFVGGVAGIAISADFSNITLYKPDIEVDGGDAFSGAIGALVGSASHNRIMNCGVFGGRIFAQYLSFYTGLSQFYSSTQLSVGGLVGSEYDANIRDSFVEDTEIEVLHNNVVNTGNAGRAYIGGLVGYMSAKTGSNATIKAWCIYNSYANAKINYFIGRDSDFALESDDVLSDPVSLINNRSIAIGGVSGFLEDNVANSYSASTVTIGFMEPIEFGETGDACFVDSEFSLTCSIVIANAPLNFYGFYKDPTGATQTANNPKTDAHSKHNFIIADSPIFSEITRESVCQYGSCARIGQYDSDAQTSLVPVDSNPDNVQTTSTMSSETSESEPTTFDNLPNETDVMPALPEGEDEVNTGDSDTESIDSNGAVVDVEDEVILADDTSNDLNGEVDTPDASSDDAEGEEVLSDADNANTDNVGVEDSTVVASDTEDEVILQDDPEGDDVLSDADNANADNVGVEDVLATQNIVLQAIPVADTPPIGAFVQKQVAQVPAILESLNTVGYDYLYELRCEIGDGVCSPYAMQAAGSPTYNHWKVDARYNDRLPMFERYIVETICANGAINYPTCDIFATSEDTNDLANTGSNTLPYLLLLLAFIVSAGVIRIVKFRLDIKYLDINYVA
jgi:hypothetical protein